MERALLFPDAETAFALTVASGAFVLGLILLAAIAVLGMLRRRRRDRMAAIEHRWRAALGETTEDPAASLPRIGISDLPHFLEAWSRLLESADEETAARLANLLAVHGIDERALHLLGKRSPRMRLAAIAAAGHLREPRAWDQLAHLAQGDSPETSFAAARALLRIDPRRALDEISPSIPGRGDWPVARLASVFEALGPSMVTGPLITMLLRRPRPGLDRVVKLARFGEPQKISGVVRGWLGSSTDPDVLMAALACIEDRNDVPWAIGSAGHPDWRVRMAAARAIGRVGGRSELPALLELLRDSVWWVRYHAAHGLTKLEGLAPHELDALHEGARDAFAADMLGQALAEQEVVVSGVVAGVFWAVLAYFVLLNATYLVLHALAIRTLRNKVLLRPLENLPPVHRALVPPVSVIVSVRDAEASAVLRVRAALAFDYPDFEVVVVNDGSRDATLEALVDAFALEGFPEVYWRRIPVKPVRTIYHSRQHRNLRVVDKERGGTADACNAGINASRYPLIIALDPRWTLREDALRELVEPLVDDPDTIAVASTVRIEHDSGGPETELVELPQSLLARLQVVEHLREALFGRLGWARMNAALALPGCAILLRKDSVVDAGGFRTDMLEEQMELVARMHRLARAHGEPYQVAVIPDPVCWTPAARTLGELRVQRMRAQVALAQTLAGNRDILWQRPGGSQGRNTAALRWFAYPFFGFFERWGPAVEVSGYVLLAAMFALGLLPGLAFVGFLALVFALGFLVSMSGLLLEEMSFRLYPRWGQAARLAIAAIVENLGYRQLVALWRLDGLLRWWQAK